MVLGQRSTTEAQENTASSIEERSMMDAAEIRAQLDRILADTLFHNSKRNSNLLRYIVERSLAGEVGSLKERIIGIEVFGRPPDYDPGVDAIARVAVTEVRKRLTQFYKEAGHERELRIEIPFRSYIAEFKAPLEAPHAPPQEAAQEPGPQQTGHRSRYVFIVLAFAALVVFLAIWIQQRAHAPTATINRFWAPVIGNSLPILICIGSPEVANETSQGLDADVLSRKIPNYVKEQRVGVGMEDVHAAEDMSAYLRDKGKASIIRPTPPADLVSLHTEPLVLYGLSLNDGQMRLGAELRYRFRTDPTPGRMWIEDANNTAQRKWSINLGDPNEVVSFDYALISRVRDQTTGRWWVGIAGLTDLGTVAASRFVLDPKSISAAASSLPSDWDRKNLQFLIAVKLVQGSPGEAKVVASYSW